MGVLERLLVSRKVDGERLGAAGFGELTATAGLTWAQLLKRPEAGIEAVLPALRVELERDPLLAERLRRPERSRHDAITAAEWRYVCGRMLARSHATTLPPSNAARSQSAAPRKPPLASLVP